MVIMSLPVWAAWIEILQGLVWDGHKRAGRCPYGRRGLKSYRTASEDFLVLSLPVWAAWIEMSHGNTN